MARQRAFARENPPAPLPEFRARPGWERDFRWTPDEPFAAPVPQARGWDGPSPERARELALAEQFGMELRPFGETVRRFMRDAGILDNQGFSAEMGMSLLPHLFKMHPFLRALDIALLLREMMQQSRGGGGAPRAEVRFTPEAELNPPELPAGYRYVAIYTNNGWSYAAVIHDGWLGSGYTGGATVPEGIGDPETLPTMLQRSGIYDFESEYIGTYSQGGVGTLVGPGVVIRSARNQGEAEVLVTGPAAAPKHDLGVKSDLGFGAPNELSGPRDTLARFQLPNQVPGQKNVTWAQQGQVNQFREEMGLREVLEVVPEVRTEVRAPEPSIWSQALPGTSVRLQPKGRWRTTTPHRYRPPEPGVREHKFKAAAAYTAVKFVANAWTETNDFLREIHRTIPKHCRTARRTRSGNYRTDAMLGDIYRCWSRIDWDEAAINLQINSLEDQTFGMLGILKTGAMFAAKRGQGLGGFGGDRALSGGEYLLRGEDRRDPAYRDGVPHPIAQMLDSIRDRRLNQLRRYRAAIRGE